MKPDASNTGATGTLPSYTGPLTITAAGTTIENVTVNGDLRIQAANVTVRNVKVTGSVGVLTTTGTRVTRLTAPSLFISSSADVVLDRSNFGFAANGDSLHVTSDAGSLVTDVAITNNYIHDPRPSQGDHYDGLQVRGVNRMTVQCNNFDLGPATEEGNAAVYLESANGGHSNVVVDQNWLFGGAFGFMYSADNDGRTRLTNNHFGGDYRWDDPCYAPGAIPPVQTGNDWNGQPVIPCS